MYCNVDRINDPEELEDLSCTDLKQQWGKLKKAALSEFEALPLSEFCHYTPPSVVYACGIPDVPEDLASDFAKLIIQGILNISYILHSHMVELELIIIKFVLGAPKSEVYLHSSGARENASRVNCKPDTMATEVLAMRQAAGELTEALLGNDGSLCFK